MLYTARNIGIRNDAKLDAGDLFQFFGQDAVFAARHLFIDDEPNFDATGGGIFDGVDDFGQCLRCRRFGQ